MALWLPAASNLSCFVLFVFLLLGLVDPVYHYYQLVWEEGAGCFAWVCGLCTVSHGLFALPLGVIGRLRFMTVIFSNYENTPIQIYRKCHLQKLKIFR